MRRDEDKLMEQLLQDRKMHVSIMEALTKTGHGIDRYRASRGYTTKMPAPPVSATYIARGVLMGLIFVPPYNHYIKLALTFVAPEDSEKTRKDLKNAILENIINQKENSFDILQRRYNLPYSHSVFCDNRHKFVTALMILMGMEDILYGES